MLIFLLGFFYEGDAAVDPVLFFLLVGGVEVAALAVDGALEDDRNIGMRGLDGLDEGEEPLFDLFDGGVGEGVDNECVDVRPGNDPGEALLELAVAAYAEAQVPDRKLFAAPLPYRPPSAGFSGRQRLS